MMVLLQLSGTFRDFSWYKNRSRPVQMSPTCWATGVGSASDESFLKGSENGSLLGAFDESASAPFVTLEAEITPETIDFFVSDAEGDPDCPTEGYSSIEQALHTLHDENRDIEGNLIMAASLASPQQVSFLIKNGSVIVSVGMKEEDLERLKLPLMSPETENEDSSAPTFTVTVDAKSGTCTGVSASDRAKTVLALSSPETKPEDFRRPGHVFPLKYRNGGVLRRAGPYRGFYRFGDWKLLGKTKHKAKQSVPKKEQDSRSYKEVLSPSKTDHVYEPKQSGDTGSQSCVEEVRYNISTGDSLWLINYKSPVGTLLDDVDCMEISYLHTHFCHNKEE
uniref:Monofunctional riboflavin biosynthesis protein RIBA 3, chloroplastic n=1 Tax=Populus alba TaxID=43335 RepID=A0A4U5PVV0_POPAL|nr:monofunctional riboflavin biosynthesis protein RIBA 3, chloroplastic [Populus alba]